MDAAYCCRPSSIVCQSVCLSVSWSVVIVRPAKTAEPIEMLFGLWTQVGQGLDGVQMPHAKGQF